MAHLKTDKFISYKTRLLDPWNVQVKKSSYSLYMCLYHKWHIQLKASIVNSHQWLRNDTLPYKYDLSLFFTFYREKTHLLYFHLRDANGKWDFNHKPMNLRNSGSEVNIEMVFRPFKKEKIAYE